VGLIHILPGGVEVREGVGEVRAGVAWVHHRIRQSVTGLLTQLAVEGGLIGVCHIKGVGLIGVCHINRVGLIVIE
jgi:hypothetical protein